MLLILQMYLTYIYKCLKCFDLLSAILRYPFDSLTEGEFTDGSNPTTTLRGDLKAAQGVQGTSLYLDGNVAASIDVGDHSCITDTSLCAEEFTLAFWFKVDPMVSINCKL